MIRINGILNVKSIKGTRGAFSVGELTTPVGNFKVKDQILDQFSEGSYEGEFLVAHIYPTSYVHFGKVIIEVRAKLAEIILPDGEEKPVTVQGIAALISKSAREMALCDLGGRLGKLPGHGPRSDAVAA